MFFLDRPRHKLISPLQRWKRMGISVSIRVRVSVCVCVRQETHKNVLGQLTLHRVSDMFHSLQRSG